MTEQRFAIADTPKKPHVITDDDQRAEQLALLAVAQSGDIEARFKVLEKRVAEIETMLRRERDNLHG